ncbi:MAG: hypothetical protein QGF07_05450, partial [Phycisphaerales bacterium]|nr:hypothetical protein [Phycisphaerales bacterium]
HQSLVLLFFVVAMFLVSGTPCFALLSSEQGEPRRERKKIQNFIKDKMSIIKMNLNARKHDQCPCCQSKENANGTEPEGEISGSVALTGDGKVWLTVFLDDAAVLARINLFDRENGELTYRLVIEKLERATQTHCSVSSDVLNVLDEEARMAEFSCQDEASLELLRLIDVLGIEIQSGTRRAIPIAIGCGWRSPETCKQLIEEAIEAQKDKNGEN